MKHRTSWLQAAAVLIACAAAFPLLQEPGLLNTRGGGDSPFLLQRLHQLMAALADGHFPVRWMPDANYGYGYPFFNFYAPLAFYVAAVFRFFGFSYVRAIQLSQLAAFGVAAVGMFKLAQRWLSSDWGALVASAAYTLAPFHLVNIYTRGDSIAEFWAMAFYPLALLGVDRVASGQWQRSEGRLFDSALSTQHPLLIPPAFLTLVLAYAALILSHNISALIFSPFLLAYGLWQVASSKSKRSLALALAFSLLLALALAAFFWLPALGEQGLTQLGGVTADYFNYANHFRSGDLVQRGFFFDFGVGQQQAFRMGVVQAVLTAVGGAASLWLWRRSTTSPLRFTLLAFLVATLMVTPLSRPLWDYLPLLPFTQFPWRFLSVQSCFGALLIGAILPAVERWRLGAQPALLGLMVVGLMGLLGFSSLGRLETDHLPLTDAEITAERLAQYEWFTGNIGTTISAEYLPPSVIPRPFTSGWLITGERWAASVTAGEATAAPEQTATSRHIWHIDVRTPEATVVLPILHWAGWAAAADGQPLPITPAPSSGLIQLTLPQGAHTVTLALGRTPLRLTAELISLAAVLALLALSGWQLAARPLSIILPSTPFSPYPSFLILSLFLLLIFLLPQPPATGPQTWDFGEMGYLHPQREGITYGNGAVLAGYRLSTAAAAPGDTLTLTLNWAAQPTGDLREATVALFTPAVNRFNHVQPLTAAAQPLRLGTATYQLSIPADAPPGLYFPQITLSDDNRPRTPSGRIRARGLALAPIHIISGQLPLENRQRGGLAVVPLSVEAADGLARLHLGWWTAAPLAENLGLSLRLTTLDGREIFTSQFDTQPGYGYLPSSSWPRGAWTADWLTLTLPDPTAEPPPYALLVALYDLASGRPRLTRRLGELHPTAAGALAFQPNQLSFVLPPSAVPLEATFSAAGKPILKLSGYELNKMTPGEAAVDITLYWEALGEIAADYTVFVHLLDPATGQPIAQHDAMPRHNSYPTSQWTPGEIVADPARLDVSEVAVGSYPLTAGFYLRQGEQFVRLTATDSAGNPIPNNAVLITTLQR